MYSFKEDMTILNTTWVYNGIQKGFYKDFLKTIKDLLYTWVKLGLTNFGNEGRDSVKSVRGR